jgi:hypothetical protein
MKLVVLTRLSAKLLAIYLLIVTLTLSGLFAVFEAREYTREQETLEEDLKEFWR